MNDFEKISGAVQDYSVKIDTAFSEREKNIDRVKSIYNDEAFSKVVDANNTVLHSIKRDAYDTMSRAIGESVVSLRHSLDDAMKFHENEAFKSVQVLNASGAKLTEKEVQNLVNLAGGDYSTLKGIQSIAERSGIEVSFPGLDDFEKDLRYISNIPHTIASYSPRGKETLALYDMHGYQVCYSNDTLKEIPEKLEEIRNKWQNKGTPTVRRIVFTKGDHSQNGNASTPQAEKNPEQRYNDVINTYLK